MESHDPEFERVTRLRWKTEAEQQLRQLDSTLSEIESLKGQGNLEAAEMLTYRTMFHAFSQELGPLSSSTHELRQQLVRLYKEFSFQRATPASLRHSVLLHLFLILFAVVVAALVPLNPVAIAVYFVFNAVLVFAVLPRRVRPVTYAVVLWALSFQLLAGAGLEVAGYGYGALAPLLITPLLAGVWYLVSRSLRSKLVQAFDMMAESAYSDVTLAASNIRQLCRPV